jgi:2-methylisocitrate lyase-like PEP mutase family enzyme
MTGPANLADGASAAVSAATALRAMHASPQPLVLPNVWDPVSARAFAGAGFGALATSSSAVAATLGYADGETPATEMLAAVSRIASSVSVPVSADVEAGYDLPPAELVGRLIDAGIAGCNLEDSDRASGVLIEAERQADFLAAVRAEAGAELVINARVDVYVRQPAGHAATADPARLQAATDDAVARANRYLAAGADCTYPILAPTAALAELVQRISGSVNVMFLPGGLTMGELAELGVARITFGGGLHARAAKAIQEMAAALATEL